MITKVRKKIYYRMATFEGVDASITLQSLLKKILESGVGSRQQQLNPDEKTFRAINQHAECQGMTCCQVIQVDPNAYQPVMIYDSGTPEEYRIDAVSTTELGREDLKSHSDFVNSMLYFGVKGNEVVVMPSSALTMLSLERYLGWLLFDKKLIPEDAKFALIKTFTPNVDELIRQHPVRSVQIGAPILNESSSFVNEGEKKGESSKDNVTVKDGVSVNVDSLGAKILKILLREGNSQDSWVNDLSDQSNLQAKLVISYSRKTDPAGRKLMNVIGSSLRNIDDSELILTLDGCGVLRGEQLNLSKTIDVEKTTRGLYATGNLYRDMVAWLIEIHEKKE